MKLRWLLMILALIALNLFLAGINYRQGELVDTLMGVCLKGTHT